MSINVEKVLHERIDVLESQLAELSLIISERDRLLLTESLQKQEIKRTNNELYTTELQLAIAKKALEMFKDLGCLEHKTHDPHRWAKEALRDMEGKAK